MREKNKLAIQAMLTMLMTSLVLPYSSQAIEINITNPIDDIITVDINGNGKYKSIQTAIDNENAGSKILVKIGTYTETIKIWKQIELTGEDNENTIISPASAENKCAITIKAENVKISRLNIENRGPGIYASAIQVTSSKAMISNCEIHDTPIGIAIWTSGNTIQDCHFHGCSDEGIAFLGSSESTCNNNKVINCVFENNCDGIELQHSSGNLIENCDFYHNTHDGIDAIKTGNNNNIISNCRIQDNNVHGIYLSGSHGNKIINCQISGNHEEDICISQDSKDNEIINTNRPAGNQITGDRTGFFINEITKTLGSKNPHPILAKILYLIENRFMTAA
jgi:parallel beta-helix repeat protein